MIQSLRSFSNLGQNQKGRVGERHPGALFPSRSPSQAEMTTTVAVKECCYVPDADMMVNTVRSGAILWSRYCSLHFTAEGPGAQRECTGSRTAPGGQPAGPVPPTTTTLICKMGITTNPPQSVSVRMKWHSEAKCLALFLAHGNS